MTEDRQFFSSRLALLALAINLGLALSYVGLWLITAQEGLFWRADFSAFYTGWKMVNLGESSRLYDFDAQTRLQREILAGRSFADELLPFDYPPHTAWMFAPLARLPLATAYGLWSIGQLALLLWFLRLLTHLTCHWQRGERLLMIVSVLAFTPLFYTILLGNFGLVLAVCVLQFYLAWQTNRQIALGAWLSLASIKPQSVVLLGVITLAARRWRAAITVLGIGLVLVITTSALLGWSVWQDFAGVILEVGQLSGKYGIVPQEMFNLRGLLASLGGDEAAKVVSAISLLTFLLTIAGVFWMWKARQQKQVELKFALTICLGMLFSLHLYPQDCLLLVIPAVLFYDHLRSQAVWRRGFAAFALSSPLVFIVSEFTLRGRLSIRIPIVLIVILTVWIAKVLWDERKS